jgi:hypothetical protein
MFAVTCPKCEKQLYFPDTTRGKHVRCSGCQEIVLASNEPKLVAAAPLPVRKATPPPVPTPAPIAAPPVEETAPVPDAVPGLSCANCEASAVVELPPDANSRNPGYICAMCQTRMRPAGSVGNYYAALLLGVVIVLLGAGLVVVALEAKQQRGKLIGGGAAVAVLGGVVAGWAFFQTRLPIPTGAEPAPSRFGFWSAIILIALLLAAGGLFAFKYILHEML